MCYTRQNGPLPSANIKTLGKVSFLCILEKHFVKCKCKGTQQSLHFCRVSLQWHLAKLPFLVTASPSWHSAKTLSLSSCHPLIFYFLSRATLTLNNMFAECRHKTLVKELFAVKIGAERPMLRVGLGIRESFVECFSSFGTRQTSCFRSDACIQLNGEWSLLYKLPPCRILPTRKMDIHPLSVSTDCLKSDTNVNLILALQHNTPRAI